MNIPITGKVNETCRPKNKPDYAQMHHEVFCIVLKGLVRSAHYSLPISLKDSLELADEYIQLIKDRSEAINAPIS